MLGFNLFPVLGLLALTDVEMLVDNIAQFILHQDDSQIR